MLQIRILLLNGGCQLALKHVLNRCTTAAGQAEILLFDQSGPAWRGEKDVRRRRRRLRATAEQGKVLGLDGAGCCRRRRDAHFGHTAGRHLVPAAAANGDADVDPNADADVALGAHQS